MTTKIYKLNNIVNSEDPYDYEENMIDDELEEIDFELDIDWNENDSLYRGLQNFIIFFL